MVKLRNVTGQYTLAVGEIVFDTTTSKVIYSTNGSDNKILMDSNLKGPMGINTSGLNAQLEVNATDGKQMRLTYNDNDGNALHYSDFNVDSGGDLTIKASGGDILLDSSNNLNITSYDGSTSGLKFNGTLITSSATEINTLHSVTPGTASASKALILDSSLDISGINNLSASQLTGTLQTSAQPNITSLGSLSSLDISGTTASTSSSSGILTLAGGIGISNTTDATSSTNGGSLTTAGGLAVAKSAFIGNNLTVGGNLYVAGTTTSVDSSAIDLSDNLIVINSGPSGAGFDSGLLNQRFQLDVSDGSGDVVGDTPAETSTVASGSGTSIVLNTATSSTDNYYNNWWIKITSGSQSGTVRQVTDYTGSSKTLTLDEALAGSLSSNDSISLYNTPYTAFVWQESSKRYITAYTASDPGKGPVTVQKHADFETGKIYATSTSDSTSSSTGAIQSSGGIGISSTTDATSSTNGGTFTTAGGAAIAKNLYVGSGIYGTLQTAAQPNITSVGTLTSLSLATDSSLTINGTLLTSTAAELNKLDGVTPGTASAGLALVTDNSNNLTGLNSLNTISLSLNGTALTSTAAELNYLHGITPGTVVANAAVVTDSSNNLTGLNSLSVGALTVNGVVFNPATSNTVLNGVTPGVVSAGQAVIVDSNKDIATFNNLGATTLTASKIGSSTSSVTTVGTFKSTYSGTVANGFGVNLDLITQNSAGTAITSKIQNYIVNTGVGIELTEFKFIGKKTGADATFLTLGYQTVFDKLSNFDVNTTVGAFNTNNNSRILQLNYYKNTVAGSGKVVNQALAVGDEHGMTFRGPNSSGNNVVDWAQIYSYVTSTTSGGSTALYFLTMKNGSSNAVAYMYPNHSIYNYPYLSSPIIQAQTLVGYNSGTQYDAAVLDLRNHIGANTGSTANINFYAPNSTGTDTRYGYIKPKFISTTSGSYASGIEYYIYAGGASLATCTMLPSGNKFMCQNNSTTCLEIAHAGGGLNTNGEFDAMIITGNNSFKMANLKTKLLGDGGTNKQSALNFYVYGSSDSNLALSITGNTSGGGDLNNIANATATGTYYTTSSAVGFSHSYNSQTIATRYDVTNTRMGLCVTQSSTNLAFYTGSSNSSNPAMLIDTNNYVNVKKIKGTGTYLDVDQAIVSKGMVNSFNAGASLWGYSSGTENDTYPYCTNYSTFSSSLGASNFGTIVPGSKQFMSGMINPTYAEIYTFTVTHYNAKFMIFLDGKLVCNNQTVAGSSTTTTFTNYFLTAGLKSLLTIWVLGPAGGSNGIFGVTWKSTSQAEVAIPITSGFDPFKHVNPIPLAVPTRFTVFDGSNSGNNIYKGELSVSFGNLILDATNNVQVGTSNSFDIPGHNGVNRGLKLNGALVTATAAELNVLHDATAGTAVASKALLVDSNKNISSLGTIGAAILNLTDTTASTSSTTGALKLVGGLAINLSTDATSSTNGGTFTTAGGAAIAKKLYVGTDLNVSGLFTLGTTTLSVASNVLSVSEALNLSSTTDATDSTTGGSFTTAGGAAIAKKLYVGTDLSVGGSFTLAGTALTSTAAELNLLAGVTAGTVSTSKALVVDGSSNLSGMSNLSLQTLTVLDTTASTSPSVGSVKLAGGLSISNTTDATGNSNGGSITTAGGLAVAKSAYIGNNLTVGGNLIVSGTTTQVNSTVTNIADNAIILNSGPTGAGHDSGFLTQRYQIANDDGTGDIVNDTFDETYALVSATSSTVVLPNTANITNDFYKDWWIKITSGTGNNQVRKVTDYDGSTNTLTLESTFTTTPSASDTINLYPNIYSTFLWQTSQKRFATAYSTNDYPFGSLNVLDYADLATNNMSILSTATSTSNVTGALQLVGGIGINNTTDATSSTNGGTFTTAGGAAIAKKLYVGTDLNVANTLYTTSLTLNNVALTSSATELNYLAGVTPGTASASKALVVSANRDIGNVHNITTTYLTLGSTLVTSSADELNYLDGSTPGVATASNALVVDQYRSISNINTLAIASLVLGGTSITSTSTELNYLHGVTPGTATASNAVVLDASKNITGLNNVTVVGLTLGSTALTASATELNYLDGSTPGTATANNAVVLDSSKNVTGINVLDVASLTINGSAFSPEVANSYLNGITTGTVTANKAVVVDANKDITGFNSVTMNSLTLGSTALTASATELNYLDGVTPGTASASNAVVLDSSSNITGLNSVTMTSLTLGSTALTASATELNYLDGVTPGTVSASLAVVVDSNKDISGFNSLSATSLTGTIQTATQSNITQVGVLDGLTVNKTDAGTDNILYPLTVSHNSSGVSAAGFGVGVNYKIEDDANNMKAFGTTTITAANTATGAEDANFSINVLSGGAMTEIVRASYTGDLFLYNSGQLQETSDKRVKEDIYTADMEDSFNRIMQIDVKNYKFIGKNREHRGFIAQELKEIIPEAINVQKANGFDDFHTICYKELIGYLVQSNQFMAKKIEKLEAQLETFTKQSQDPLQLTTETTATDMSTSANISPADSFDFEMNVNNETDSLDGIIDDIVASNEETTIENATVDKATEDKATEDVLTTESTSEDATEESETNDATIKDATVETVVDVTELPVESVEPVAAVEEPTTQDATVQTEGDKFNILMDLVLKLNNRLDKLEKA